MSARCYLDNAATSWPKPEPVLAAMDRYHRELGVAAGRGATRAASEVDATIARCRQRAAELFSAESSERIVFTFNGTDSLNLAIQGALRPGDHVIASTLEHNSVLRPLSELRRRIGIETTFIAPEPHGRVEPAKFREALRPNTRLIALLHASNVTGVVQPIDDVGEIARSAGALMLVDAAQTAGHLPINVRNHPIDLLACPGHKGLLGPLGTGLLYLRPGCEEQVQSLRQGGTGSQSEEDRQPSRLPDKYESGNHNAPGLFGLGEALDWLSGPRISDIHTHELALRSELIKSLREIPSVRMFAAEALAEHAVGVLSLTIDGFDPQEVAAILDHDFQIQVRAGLHCAPGAHRSLDTLATGGTVRISFGPYSTADQVQQLVAALRSLTGV
jgi:cysteine desulfurase family protein